MADPFPIDKFELRLRGELEDAERALRNATLEEKPQMLRRFKAALHQFTVWVFEGKLEPRRR